MKKVSLLIPAYNEEETIPLLYNELNKVIDKISGYEFEILFVNDGSSDNTLNILRDLRKRDSRVNYISFSRNFGKETAMAAGFDYVTGDATVILDADLQDPPELIEEMIFYWEKGYDDVYAKEEAGKGKRGLKNLLLPRFINCSGR